MFNLNREIYFRCFLASSRTQFAVWHNAPESCWQQGNTKKLANKLRATCNHLFTASTPPVHTDADVENSTKYISTYPALSHLLSCATHEPNASVHAEDKFPAFAQHSRHCQASPSHLTLCWSLCHFYTGSTMLEIENNFICNTFRTL